MKTSRTGRAITKFDRPDKNQQAIHPAWMAFIRYCREMGFGEISQLKIQDGLPVMAEETTKKVKFF